MDFLRFETGLIEVANDRALKGKKLPFDHTQPEHIQAVERESIAVNNAIKMMGPHATAKDFVVFPTDGSERFRLKAGQHRVAALAAIHKALEAKGQKVYSARINSL